MSREIVLAVEVAAAPDTVYEAVTSEQGLASFWTPDVSASPKVGAQLRFGFEPAPVDLELTVSELTEDAQVVWQAGDAWPHWHGTTMTWRLDDSPGKDNTRVVLTHEGWADDYPDPDLGSVAYTWSLVLGALKAYAESGTPQPALG